MTRNTRRFGVAVVGLALAMATSAAAQTAPKAANSTPPPATDTTRSAKTTANGDTGLFFVPTAEVLPTKKFSFSLYRTNFDDGQGFSDMSNFPVTLGVGIGGHVEAYGAYNVLTRIDRRARPMFFTSTAAETSSGTGGGILPNYPLARSQWVSTNGDLSLGVKINLTSEADKKPLAFAIRGGVKIPTGSKTDGTTSGEMDYSFDGIISKEAGKVADLSAYAEAPVSISTYTQRKKAAVVVAKKLTSADIRPAIRQTFLKAKKKDDLSDALLHALAALCTHTKVARPKAKGRARQTQSREQVGANT